MKLAILTQPLNWNYGGILQNYALQTVLKNMGHDVITIDRHSITISWLRYYIGAIKRAVLKYLLRNNDIVVFPYKYKRNKLTQEFVTKYISKTKVLQGTQKLDCLDLDYDAYVVGSDQVWRPCYSQDLTSYFLDFVKNKKEVKRIAYAASFGVENWEFTPEQTQMASELIQLFDWVSVREDSAVSLCRDNLNAHATHVLDPTLLLSKEEYIDLVRIHYIGKESQNNKLFCYILDESAEKIKIVDCISAELNISPFTIMPADNTSPYPSIEAWLKGFIDAEYIITDSFHGCVFSILFNKPFIAIGNKERGMTRFNSLLKLFGLEDRLIMSYKEITIEQINKKIDFEKVNAIRIQERNKAIDFLSKYLNKNVDKTA